MEKQLDTKGAFLALSHNRAATPGEVAGEWGVDEAAARAALKQLEGGGMAQMDTRGRYSLTFVGSHLAKAYEGLEKQDSILKGEKT